MDSMVMWICVCTIALIGVACMVGDLLFVRRSQKLNTGSYRIVTLYDDPTEVEAVLNRHLLRLTWNGPDCLLLLVDMGLGKESKRVVERVLPELYCSLFCTEKELPEILRKLDKDDDALSAFSNMFPG